MQGNSEDHPVWFICPITHCLMSDPVILPDGYTYEKSEIKRWLNTNNVSPVTRKKFNKDVELISNRGLKDAIDDYRLKFYTCDNYTVDHFKADIKRLTDAGIYQTLDYICTFYKDPNNWEYTFFRKCESDTGPMGMNFVIERINRSTNPATQEKIKLVVNQNSLTLFITEDRGERIFKTLKELVEILKFDEKQKIPDLFMLSKTSPVLKPPVNNAILFSQMQSSPASPNSIPNTYCSNS